MPRPPRRFALVALLVVLWPSFALACLWDYDTIHAERARFPSVLELITGKFLRHSPEFYAWRIEDRLRRLEAEPSNVALLDDLAVAYDKTGRQDKAVETAKRTEAIQPGRYETVANLGTFHVHAGRLQEGLTHIDRALAINPDAHFGREVYQKKLVEYVLRRRNGGPLKLPLSPDSLDTFAKSLADETGGRLSAKDLEAAVKGVSGMMRFGHYDSPVLLEALGGLLLGDGMRTEDAKLLAARAYLKASYEVADEGPRAAYREMAKRALNMQTTGPGSTTQISLEQVEAEFRRELDEAKAWYDELRGRESSWVREGKDADAEFAKLYAAAPVVSDGLPVSATMLVLRWGGIATALALLAVLGYVVWRVRSRAPGR